LKITAVVVQARMASSRLPGKVLMDLGGRTVLSHVIERCMAIRNSSIVCCAVSDRADCEPVAEEAERCGAIVFRGSDHDVLERYYMAAVDLKADAILRVTSDCPLIDPEVAANLIDLFCSTGADFATNNMPPLWPHGLDCEAISLKWLERAWKEAVDPMDREHVSPFIRRHPDARIVNLKGPGGQFSDHRWTLDYPEDIEFFRALFAQLPREPQIASMKKILSILSIQPEISDINRMHHKARNSEGRSDVEQFTYSKSNAE